MLERRLLLLDGVKSPETFDMSKRFRLTRGECMTVAEFYPPATGANVSQSVKHLAWCTHFLASPNRQWRWKLLHRIKPELCDIFIPAEDDEDCVLYVDELVTLYNEALNRYPEMAAQLLAHLKDGTELGEDFLPSFDPHND